MIIGGNLLAQQMINIFEAKQAKLNSIPTISSEFKTGDRVWLDSTEFIDDPNWIRKIQTIESTFRVPIDDDPRGYTLSINLVGIPYLFNESDIRLA